MICGWIRTAHERQLVKVTTASSGLRFGRSSTRWKAYQVYFQMGPESLSYLHRGGRNRRFESDCFLSKVLCHLILAQRAVYRVGP
jgi:hypothetical protein